jgi:hypothetical protein
VVVEEIEAELEAAFEAAPPPRAEEPPAPLPPGPAREQPRAPQRPLHRQPTLYGYEDEQQTPQPPQTYEGVIHGALPQPLLGYPIPSGTSRNALYCSPL